MKYQTIIEESRLNTKRSKKQKNEQAGRLKFYPTAVAVSQISEEIKVKLAGKDPTFCQYHQDGHCWFGSECQKHHTKVTCDHFPCVDDKCLSRL